ncbi:MAG: hypothetical protein AB1568_16290 [Thermodesulfobacteriota bacterium]
MLRAILEFDRTGQLTAILNGGFSDGEAAIIWKALDRMMTRQHERGVLQAARQGLACLPRRDHQMAVGDGR